MHEITFNMTFRDRLEGYRIGLGHMRLLYRAIWCGVLLLWMVGFILISYGKGYPTTWPLSNLPPRSLALSMGLLLGITLGSIVFTSLVFGYLFRSLTVQVLPMHLAYKRKISSQLVRWKDVNAILVTGEYICFCQDIPSAIVVPKLAFTNQEQATAFCATALEYWHKAKGTAPPPVPDTAGSWPPAPRVSNSVEPGDNRKR